MQILHNSKSIILQVWEKLGVHLCNDTDSIFSMCEKTCLSPGLGLLVFKGCTVITGIGPFLRKIAVRVKMRKVIEQQGDQYIIKTISSFRNYNLTFRVGQEFEEFTWGLDGRHVKVRRTEQRCIGNSGTVDVCWMVQMVWPFTDDCLWVICVDGGDVGGQQTSVWTDRREEKPRLDSLDWRQQTASGEDDNKSLLKHFFLFQFCIFVKYPMVFYVLPPTGVVLWRRSLQAGF